MYLNNGRRVVNPAERVTEYVYDNHKRLKFWQTAAQQADGKFSYIDYDRSGRIIERGVGVSNEISGIQFQNSENEPSLSAGFTSTNDYLELAFGETAFIKEEVDRVEYDVKDYYFPSALSNYKHDFLKGKVSKTLNDESTTWYGYDMRGRLLWTVQYINELDRNFTINYNYNAQGNIETLDFQKEVSSERFVHHYDYDANTRLVNVKTSRDGNYGNATQNAAYYYYQHGPLKRVELADELQGIDYVYTINGQLKSINNPVLGDRDPGKDGETGSPHANFAQDIFGMTLEYYRGDYTRAGTAIQTYSEHTFSVPSGSLEILPEKFNGSIQSMRWRTRSEVNTATPEFEGVQLIYAPKYDARNRILSAQFGTISASYQGFQNTGQVSGVNEYDGPTPSFKQDYKVWDIDYDLNGNLMHLKRNGNTTSGLDMDDLTFNRSGNKLNYVSDVHNQTYGSDLPNQSSSGNYTYDASGRMASDLSENNYLSYNSNNLPLSIHSNVGKTILKSGLFYDERGQRLFKEIYDQGNLVTKQYYIRDVNGTLMTIISDDYNDQETIYDYPIYGSQQLGFYTSSSEGNSYRYQLTDHLGNVRATIGGTKVGGDVALLDMQDYYPFGSAMPGRSITMSTFYKLGYQSQPVDEETGLNAFELRLYDARIGGWLSPDPYKQHFSPYMAMSNNPLSFIDPDGGMDGNPGDDPDGQLAMQISTNAFDRFSEMCPTCTPGELSDMFVSMRRNGIVDPELMQDMATDLAKTGEREERFFDFDNRSVHIFQVHEFESRPNPRFASMMNIGIQQERHFTVNSDANFVANGSQTNHFDIVSPLREGRIEFDLIDLKDKIEIFNSHNVKIFHTGFISGTKEVTFDRLRRLARAQETELTRNIVIKITAGPDRETAFNYKIFGPVAPGAQIVKPPTIFHRVRYLQPIIISD